jgi:Fibronectin type III domain.
MKRFLLFLLTVILCLPLMTKAQQTVTVGTGTGTTYYTPFNSLWGYSFVEAIYTSSEITAAGGSAGVITSVSFEKSSGSAQNNNIVLYMKNVSRSSFSSTSDWETVTTGDIVYTGTFNISSSGWATITLDDPFIWDGTSNLMVAMHENTSGYSTQYFYYTPVTNTVISAHSDSEDPNPYNLSSFGGTVYTQSNRANMRIELTAGAGCMSMSPTVSNIGPYSADINWMNFQQAASSWDLIYGETGLVDTLTGTLVTNITDTFYTLSGLTSSTSYSVWLRSNCSGDVGPWSAPRTFTTDVSCPAPTNVAMQLGADGQSGTLSWTAGANETNWDIYIPAGNEVPNTSSTPTTSVTTNSYAVTGLNNSTNYTMYVRANCGVGDYSFWIPVSFRTPQIPAQLPYTQNWEDGTENAQWTILNGTATNQWYIGGAVNNGGDSSLYISSDNGATNSYDISSSSDVWVYRDIYFDPTFGEYGLSFDYRADAESCCDYLKVFVGPCVEPSGNNTPAGATQLGGTLNGQATWTNASFSLTSAMAGVQRLYILWHNDGSVGTAPPGAIDNISVVGFNCGHPTALTLDSTSQNSTAWVHFTPAQATDSQWEIILLTPGDTIDPSLAIPLTTTSYEFQNLSSGIEYSVYVRTDCGGDYSSWEGPLHITLGLYNMGTSGWDTLYTCGSVIYDDGGPNGVYSNSVNAYLVIYPEQPGSFVQVSGTLVAESSTYDYLIFYDGVGTTNQILKTSQSSSSTPFQIPTITSTTGPLTIYFRTDASGQYNGYELFTTCVNCVSPSPTVTNISYDEATLDWSNFTGTQTDFEIVYGPVGFNPSAATPDVVSNVTSYTIMGLTDNTSYDACIRSDCGDGTYSTWERVTFTTNPLCTEPRNVTVSQIAGTSALISWQAALVGVSDYTVEYTEAGLNNWIPQIVTGTSLFLSGLTPLTAYEVRVFSNCAAGSADTINKSFVTHCLAGGEFSIGTGTNTSTYFPSYSFYKNGYSQQIFLSSEMNGASNITSVAFEMTAVAQQRNYKIYLMHTNLSTSSTWIPADSAQLCFQGAHTFTVGWNTFEFNTPFHYNGTDNLVLIVIDENASYSSGNTFRVHTVPSNTCMMWYSDSYTYSTTSAPNSSSSTAGTTTDRNNVKFGGSCDSIITCIAPNMAVGTVDQTTAEIMWVPGYTESSWNLEYKAVSDATWTPVSGLTGSTYTITGLSANTEYTVRMQSDCGGGEVSDWRSADFRTSCGLTTTLPFVENFDSYGTGEGHYPSCWGKINTYSSDRPYVNSTNYAGAGSLYFYAGSSGTYNIAATPEFDANINISSLQAVFMYRASYNTDRLTVGVMTDPADASTFVPVATLQPSSTASDWIEQTVYFTNYTGNGHYIAFKNEYASTYSYAYIDNLEINVTPTCIRPQNLTVTGTTSSSVTLTWTEMGTATDWNVVYGPVGFDPDTVVTNIENVNTTPTVTISNLASGTPYEFYVQADCGGGDESYWRGPVAATPGSYNMHTSGWDTLYTCGAAIYDDGGPSGNYSGNCNSYLVIYPEQPGSFVQISGTIYAEYSTYDNLYIYDGVGTTNALFSTYGQSSGTLTIPTITSSTGPLTINFVSDGTVYYAGYEILTTCVNCVSPAMAVNNISSTGATLDWSSFTGSQTNFEIVYGAPTINPDNETPIVVSNVSTYALTGLTALTSYIAYIRTDCGDGTYSNWNSVSFSTMGCDPSNACVYTFVLGDGYGDGWNDGYLTVEQGSAIVATLEAIDHNLSSTQTYDTVTVSLCDNISTSLVWHSGDFDDEVSITVIKPDGTQLYTHTDMDTYTTYTFTTDCSGSGPGITDPTVTTNDATNVTQTSATLNGAITPGSESITAQGFQWKATTGGTYTTVNATGTTISYNLTGLTPNTSYTFRAFATTASGTTHGVEKTFTTLDQQQETCPSPTNVTVTDITTNSAVVTWTQPDNTANSWTVQYKQSAASSWNSATAQTTTYTLLNLEPETAYDVQVIANCTNGLTSEPSATVSFNTLPVGIDDYTLDNSVVVYPNPTRGTVQVQNTQSDIHQVMMYDAYGKLLSTVEVSGNNATLDLSGYADGLYFMRVTTDKGVVTKRVVKQ